MYRRGSANWCILCKRTWGLDKPFVVHCLVAQRISSLLFVAFLSFMSFLILWGKCFLVGTVILLVVIGGRCRSQPPSICYGAFEKN